MGEGGVAADGEAVAATGAFEAGDCGDSFAAPAGVPLPDDSGLRSGLLTPVRARGNGAPRADIPPSSIRAVLFPLEVRDGAVPISCSGSGTLGGSARVGN